MTSSFATLLQAGKMTGGPRELHAGDKRILTQAERFFLASRSKGPYERKSKPLGEKVGVKNTGSPVEELPAPQDI